MSAPELAGDAPRRPRPWWSAFPHTGTGHSAARSRRAVVSPWLGRMDADWWIDQLYDFARELGATTVRTTLSRTVIDCNRDPSGASLYPGQNTTELCPTTTFDGEPLYREGQAPDKAQIAERRATYFDPYHAAIAAELDRLKGQPQGRGALRRSLDPLAHSAPLRRRSAEFQHRHQQRR